MQKTQTNEIPKEVVSGIRKMEKIEITERQLMQKYHDIVSVSAYCQHPPIAGITLDKAIRLNKKRASVWNEIRSFEIKGYGRTLWQIAIEKHLGVNHSGKENLLDFPTSKLKTILGLTN